MSRIGNKPVTIPSGVEITITGDNISVKGPKGTLTAGFEPEFVSIKVEGDTATVERANDEKVSRARHGLYRSVLQNLVTGVTEGFSKKLEIRGVGYRGSVAGKILELNLGYSHPIKFDIPEGIEIKFEDKSQNFLEISGMDKQRVGSVAAKIRSFRKPEPYKGKGVRYTDEHVAMKAGKSAKA